MTTSNKFYSIKDRVKASGRVEILIIREATGQQVDYYDLRSNLIMTNFRTNETYLLAGSSLTQRAIDKMQVGTSAVAETITDTVITNPVDIVLSSYDYPAAKSVRFIGTLGAGDGNGVEFREVGLLLANGSLAARRTFAILTKAAEFTWTFRWTLTWA